MDTDGGTDKIVFKKSAGLSDRSARFCVRS